MKEKWMKMVFGRFYIKNYHANYNSYFPLKVKGLTGKNIGYQVSKLGYLCPQYSRGGGGNYPQDSRGGVFNPNNPPPLYTPLCFMF